MPTYNRAITIKRAVDSILKQTYQDFEIIIVDDGSTDNTYEIVKEFNEKRIKYIKHEKNKGASAARNTGIRESRGKYLAFQDSDDQWLPNKLKRQVEILDNSPNEVGIVYCGFWRFNNNKKIYYPSGKVIEKEGNVYKSLINGNFIGTPTAIIKKECFNKYGCFDERLPRLQDWELFIRLSKNYEFRFVNEPLVLSYFVPNCISSDNRSLITAQKIILKKHFLKLNDGNITASHIYCTGKLVFKILINNIIIYFKK
ncbi:glycosyltransferase family 2 protein [Pelotomaculum propionicicum]|uniref:glycosyltransferase family 2 protein n=1 Tax=Pelotomaculum propionicicum TaxID=258475 RepID=UPI003B7A44DC